MAANYWSCAMEGVPFGVRYPSLSMAEDAAKKHMVAFKDIEQIDIVKVALTKVTTVFRETPYDPFAGVGL